MSDADKRCTYVNAAWTAFTGRTLEDLLADGWRETIHAHDLPRCLEVLDAAFQRRQPFTLEYRLRRHDGEYRWVLTSGIPRLAPDGSWTGYVGSSVDITERRLAEASLRRKESELTEAQRLTAIGSWQWDAGTDEVVWSDELYRIAGLEPGSCAAAASNHPHLYPPEHWERIKRCADEAMRSGTPYELDVEMFSNGGRLWVTARGEAMRHEDGRIMGLRGTVQDITARKRAEAMISNQSRRLLEAQEAERARIARELHDDIAQRLVLLSMALKELQQSADSAGELHRSLAALSRQTVDIANDLQALSHELHSYKLQLLGVVPAIKGFCSEVSARHHVDVEFTHEDVPRTVRPDIALCLFRVLQEALQNGVRHSGAARFAVSLEGTPKVLRLTVRDGGQGFNPESAPRDRGLGLTSMRERLKLVAGELAIHSKPGSGTTVVAQVPLPVALAQDVHGTFRAYPSSPYAGVDTEGHHNPPN
jgi:PAS domain S-box-containing protein